MSTRELQLSLPVTVVYVTGTVNGVEKTFTLTDGVWKTVVDRTYNDIYEVSILAVDSLGKSSRLTTTIYYGLQLITDRTAQDVSRETEKGFYNYTDLNRVESACKTVSEMLNSSGYPTTLQPQKTWAETDFWSESEMIRYLDNVSHCKNQLGIPDDYFSIPESMDWLTWQGANAIEKSLEGTAEFIAKIKDQQVYSGTFFAGEE